MSEQGQAPPPPEPGAPRNDPQAKPAPDQATTPLPADAPAGASPQPTAELPTPAPAAGEPAATPAAPTETSAPTTETSTAAEPPPAAAPIPVAAAPAGPGRVRRVAGHRATQLVAVGLLGLVLGGGIVGAIAANRFDDRGGPGHVRVYDRGERGPDRGDRGYRGGDKGGDRFEQRGPFGERGDRFER